MDDGSSRIRAELHAARQAGDLSLTARGRAADGARVARAPRGGLGGGVGDGAGGAENYECSGIYSGKKVFSCKNSILESFIVQVEIRVSGNSALTAFRFSKKNSSKSSETKKFV